MQEDLKAKKITCVDLVNQYVKKIEEKKHLNAFLEVFSDSALNQAKKVDKKISDAFDPIREVTVKAAGKEEPGILGKYSNFSKKLPETNKEGYAKPIVTKLKKGGSVSSASKRADGCCTKGKTKGRII